MDFKEDFIVQIERAVRGVLMFINIIFVPLGIMGGMATGIFIYKGNIDPSNTAAAFMTSVFALGLLCFGIYYRRKKILVNSEGILVFGILQKQYYEIQDISKAINKDRTITLYDVNHHKIVGITGLYNNYELLLEWISEHKINLTRITTGRQYIDLFNEQQKNNKDKRFH